MSLPDTDVAMPANPPDARLPFVLVHGAWHGAWAYERLAAALIAHGHPVIARDLPAHGLNARHPAAPGHAAPAGALAGLRSPVAATTLSRS